LPKLYHGGVTSIILPFAISNAIVAGSLYGMLDLATGGPNNNNNKILQTPWICGSGIGGGVGYIAPNYLYGPIMESMYGLDGLTQSMNTIMSYSMTTELSVVTGMVAGTLLHPMLYYPIHGIKGQKWQYFSGSALCITSAALAYVYYGRENVGLPIPDGSFIDSNKMALVDSVLRYNNTTNAVETYSLEKEKFIGSPTQCIEGQRIADTSRSYTANSNKVVFDDRVIAFVYAWWDAKAKDRYPEHIVNIKSQDELHQIQNSMTYTDVAVATILSADKESDNQANSKDVVMNIINNLNTQNEGRQGQLKSTSFKQLEDVTVAIELLMTMKIDQPSSTTTKTHDDDALRQTLEQFIKKRYPTLTLYTLEEQYKDESVESQLKNAKWIGSEYTDAVKRWTHVHEKETYRIWRNRSLIVVSGILLSIAGSLLQR